MRANYPGLFNPETGQPSADLSSMYDLPSLMGNRYGPLQVDRPHAKVLDANGDPTSTLAKTTRNPNFGHATEAAEPRSVRFGLALRF